MTCYLATHLGYEVVSAEVYRVVERASGEYFGQDEAVKVFVEDGVSSCRLWRATGSKTILQTRATLRSIYGAYYTFLIIL